jgi:uncharacterized protein YqeY
MLKQRIEQDLKTAMLGGDKQTVATLRGLKSVILYAEVAKGVRDEGLGDEEITALLVKEAKKRQESADLYSKGGSTDRAEDELAEKTIIEEYLPKQLSDDELRKTIEVVVNSESQPSMQNIGQIIGKVKQETKGAADGARIAQFVKERLN